MDALWRVELLGWLRAVPGDAHPYHRQAGRPVPALSLASQPGAPPTEPRSPTITRFRSRKSLALLAYLAYHRHRSHPREMLIELLWPQCLPSSGRVNLRRELTSLRRQLEPPGVPAGAVLLADRATLQLNPAVVSTDVAAFEAALQAAARAEAGAWKLKGLTQGLELYRGELLPGAFEEWALLERQRLAELYRQALKQTIEVLERQGDLRLAILWAQRGVSADPLCEELAETLIRLLGATGQDEAARRRYDELEQRLQRDAGVLPSPELRALAHSFCAAKNQNASEPAPADAAPRLSGPPSAGSMPVAGTITFLLAQPEERPAPASGRSTVFSSPKMGRGVPGEALPAAGESLVTLRALCRELGGSELTAPGELLTVAFTRASDALAAVREHALGIACSGREEADTRYGISDPPSDARSGFRVALHTGEMQARDQFHHSPALQHARLLLDATRPGQVLLSEVTAALLSADLPPSQELVDRGLYRLRPDALPERLFQFVVPGAASAPLAPPLAPPGHAGHLPPQFTRFFGRGEEIARLCALLGKGVQSWALAAAASADPSHPSGPRTRRLPPDPQRLTPTSQPLTPQARLITLTGPGGSGKTRLAIAVASRLQAWFPGGVWFVPLADLTDPALIPDQILAALRIPLSPALMPIEQLIACLSTSRFLGGTGNGRHAPRGLLLLDNLEHLLQEPAGGGEPVALQCLALLRERVPTLTMLVTSRCRLRLLGEQELPVAPLPVPVESKELRVERSTKASISDLSTLLACPSVALFLDRAQAVQADFQLTASNAASVAALCARLEGIPLALELAAARVGVLTPAQMLERLSAAARGSGGELLATRQRGIPARQRSLRATLDWSYQLLAPELRRFFARLSLFRGGWTAEAAEQVSGDPRALEYLGELRERSLVVAELSEAGREASLPPSEAEANDERLASDACGTRMRFRMRELLREYGTEQLSAAEHATVARRHAACYLALAEQAEPQLKGPEQQVWLGRLDAELDNLRAALDWCRSAAGVHEWGLRLAGSLGRFWLVRGHWAEGLERLQALLTDDGSPRRSRGLPAPGQLSLARAKALMWAGDLSLGRGDLAAARAFATESLATARALGDRRGMAAALNNLANVALARSDLERAHSLATRSLAISRAVGDLWQAALSLILLMNLTLHHGDLPTSRALAAESLAIWRKLGDIRSIAMAVQALANLDGLQGDEAAARAFLEEGMAIYQRLGDPWGACQTQRHLGDGACRQGDWAAAWTYFEESLAVARAANFPNEIAFTLLRLAEVAHARGQACAARGLLEESLSLFRKLGGRAAAATCLLRMAWLAQDQGAQQEAARLFAAADAEFTPAEAFLAPAERRENDARRAAARAVEAATAVGQ